MQEILYNAFNNAGNIRMLSYLTKGKIQKLHIFLIILRISASKVNRNINFQ